MVKPHLKLLALVISYSGNHKVRYYTVFSIGHLSGVKRCLKLLALVIPYSGNTKVRYNDIGFSLDHFNITKSQFRCPYVVTPFGIAGRGKASHEIACIVQFVVIEPQ